MTAHNYIPRGLHTLNASNSILAHQVVIQYTSDVISNWMQYSILPEYGTLFRSSVLYLIPNMVPNTILI